MIRITGIIASILTACIVGASAQELSFVGEVQRTARAVGCQPSQIEPGNAHKGRAFSCRFGVGETVTWRIVEESNGSDLIQAITLRWRDIGHGARPGWQDALRAVGFFTAFYAPDDQRLWERTFLNGEDRFKLYPGSPDWGIEYYLVPGEDRVLELTPSFPAPSEVGLDQIGNQTVALSHLEVALLRELYNRDHVALFDRNIDWVEPPFRVAHFYSEGSVRHRYMVVLWEGGGKCGTVLCSIDIWRIDDGVPHDVGQFLGNDISLGDGNFDGHPDLWIDEMRLRWNGRIYEFR